MKKWRLIPFLILLAACVDRIDFETPVADDQMVVEGKITNEPGPYTLQLSKVFSNGYPARTRTPVTGAHVDLYEDDVKIDSYTEISPGVFQSSPSTLGVIGRKYHVVITTQDNREYSSVPDLMSGPGDFDNVHYELKQDEPWDRFDIYVDARPSDAESFTRWRVNGTFRVISFPERAILTLDGGREIPHPLPCSGWRFTGYSMEQFGPCTCCECWATEHERSLHIGDPHFKNDVGYRQVNVGQVGITPRTFYDKYHVEIEQLSMSANAYEFFRVTKAQIDGVGSLFQPSFGEIKGNITSKTSGESVLGLFWASAIVRKNFFINKENLPYKVAAIDTIPDNCNIVGAPGESTFVKPSFW